jgi:hypothetical protein
VPLLAGRLLQHIHPHFVLGTMLLLLLRCVLVHLVCCWWGGSCCLLLACCCCLLMIGFDLRPRMVLGVALVAATSTLRLGALLQR